MPALLKILTGPQEGAESILRAGRDYSVGSALECDVSLIDAMMAPKQATLKLDDDGSLTLTALAEGCFVGDTVVPEDQPMPVEKYEVMTLGGTRLCYGPADGETWPEVTWTELSKLHENAAAAAAKGEEKSDEPAEAEKKEEAPDGGLAASEEKTEEKDSDGETSEENQDGEKKAGASCLKVLSLILWAVLLAFVLIASVSVGWYFWRSGEPYVVDRSKIAERNRASLQQLIEKYHLAWLEEEKALTGNFEQANDRRKVEAFLYSEMPHVKGDFTDDETLRDSLGNLLMGMEGHNLKVRFLKDCKAEVYGIVSKPKRWELVISKINEDIPKISKVIPQVIFVDETLIRIRNVLHLIPQFANVAVEWKLGQFVFEGVIPEENRQLFLETLTEISKSLPDNVQLLNAVKLRGHKEVEEGNDAGEQVINSDDSLSSLPICGIIFQPFTCIQLNDGSRIFEGGAIGELVVEKIAMDEVVFKRGDQQFIWRP